MGDIFDKIDDWILPEKSSSKSLGDYEFDYQGIPRKFQKGLYVTYGAALLVLSNMFLFPEYFKKQGQNTIPNHSYEINLIDEKTVASRNYNSNDAYIEKYIDTNQDGNPDYKFSIMDRKIKDTSSVNSYYGQKEFELFKKKARED